MQLSIEATFSGPPTPSRTIFATSVKLLLDRVTLVSSASSSSRPGVFRLNLVRKKCIHILLLTVGMIGVLTVLFFTGESWLGGGWYYIPDRAITIALVFCIFWQIALITGTYKYSWVWKKATEKSRYRLFEKITSLFQEINLELQYTGIKFSINTEYSPEYLKEAASKYVEIWQLDETTFVAGKGHRKSVQQRHYEKLKEYLSKLNEYVEKIQICGDGRNSYSKTDHSATFMRIKKDYMGNDQLLPAYNVQVGVADEYIAVVDVNQYRSDMDCFIPLMNKFHDIYGFYPKYPVADAGYGSYNNYIFCEQNGLEKYMKFPMFKKETTDRNYHEDPFRAVNFKIDGDGKMRCPNGKGFHLQYRKAIKGNAYGREEEIYQCEDGSGCPYAEKCKKGEGNRSVRVNQELTKMHQEVIQNLESIQGALLRMNRSIQAEGTFGIIKNDRWYKRIVRRGIKSVQLEVYLVSLGHNLYKFHNKQMKIKSAA